MCKALEEEQMAGRDHRPQKAQVRMKLNEVGLYRLTRMVPQTWESHPAKKNSGNMVALATQTGDGDMYLSYL